MWANGVVAVGTSRACSMVYSCLLLSWFSLVVRSTGVNTLSTGKHIFQPPGSIPRYRVRAEGRAGLEFHASMHASRWAARPVKVLDLVHTSSLPHLGIWPSKSVTVKGGG
jgi:hypothetical protein